MKRFISLFLCFFIRMTLWFRYKVTYEGLDKINPEILNKPGGVLFLPNHPTVFVDPTLVTNGVLSKYPLRPVVVEYMYYTPLVNWFMRYMNALPVPSFGETTNSLKKKKADQAIDALIDGLKKGDNFLIYPAGRVKYQSKEVISSSGVHRIIQACPEVNIVLVRTKGLWGSSFSRALTGKTPFMFSTIFQGVKIALKNILFFTPRRHVIIEYVQAPADFPFQGTRLEMNRYIEDWYNKPDGLSSQKGEEPGDSLTLVPYSIWSKELPKVETNEKATQDVDLKKIPPEVEKKIRQKISEMTEKPASEIKYSENLSTDLGLDSLEIGELIAFLDNDFDIRGVTVGDITTVGKLMALASHQIEIDEREVLKQSTPPSWFNARKKERLAVFKGNTIPEAFLNVAEHLGSKIACGDDVSGVLTYKQAKMRVILLAEYIRRLPGEHIGIMLPSSVAAGLTLLACQLAGKIPVMVNWTVGTRHLEMVREISGIKVVISSWAFLDRLENVNLNGIEDLIVTLEDVRREISLRNKLEAYFWSFRSTSAVLSHFNMLGQSPQSRAVLLFTSGTESSPKGVPLSHHNILSNLDAVTKVMPLFTDDIILSILPPFHSYGFSACTLFPLVAGFRVAFYPDPTNGKGVAEEVHRWKASLICGAPSFLKGIFSNASAGELDSLRICISGAEKAPPALYESVANLKNCVLVEGYGITECSPVLTANSGGKKEYGVGRPLDSVEICIVDLTTHQVLDRNQQGLILARGPNIFPGYINKGLSSPFMKLNDEQWYVTGDLGIIDSAGNLTISGRLKRFLKVGAEMISLASIEDALLNSLAKDVHLDFEGPPLAVCGREEAGEKTKIFVFTAFDTTLDEINRCLRNQGFSNLIKINQFWKIPKIPIMGTGKTNYRQLDALLPELEKGADPATLLLQKFETLQSKQ